jgi:hypothetical protein
VTSGPDTTPTPNYSRGCALLHRDVTRPIPGLTVHQPNDCEWDTVGVCLTLTEQTALAYGLEPANSNHRIIYVALTRASQLPSPSDLGRATQRILTV